MGLIQTETPYFQSNPNALTPFLPSATIADPTFDGCTTDRCRKAWGLRVVDSSNVFMYGAGLYNFFDNGDQTCLGYDDCQESMVSIQRSDVRFFALNTKGSTNMVVTSYGRRVPQVDNRSNTCSTLAFFQASSVGGLSFSRF